MVGLELSIRAAIQQLEKIQRTIEINDPVHMGIAAVYPYVPDQGQTLDGTPAFINTWSLRPVIRMPSLRETQYDIRMQFAFYDPNQSFACDVATAFMDAILDTFDHNTRLGGTISHHDLSGGTPTLVGFTWGDLYYVGLDLHLNIFLKDVATFS